MATKAEELYESHINLIRSKAWSYNKTTGRPFDDFMSESSEIFMRAVESWTEQSAFSTWLCKCLDNGFRRSLSKKSHNLVCEYQEEGITTIDPSHISGFMCMIDNLSKEARDVAYLILVGPCEALQILGTEPPKVIRGAVKRYLLRQGVPYHKANAVLVELREAVSC